MRRMMNNADDTQDRGLTTEQIAAAGPGRSKRISRRRPVATATMTTTPPPSSRTTRHPGPSAAVPRTRPTTAAW